MLAVDRPRLNSASNHPQRKLGCFLWRGLRWRRSGHRAMAAADEVRRLNTRRRWRERSAREPGDRRAGGERPAVSRERSPFCDFRRQTCAPPPVATMPTAPTVRALTFKAPRRGPPPPPQAARPQARPDLLGRARGPGPSGCRPPAPGWLSHSGSRRRRARARRSEGSGGSNAADRR